MQQASRRFHIGKRFSHLTEAPQGAEYIQDGNKANATRCCFCVLCPDIRIRTLIMIIRTMIILTPDIAMPQR